MKCLLIILLRRLHYKALLFLLLSAGFLATPPKAAAQQNLVNDFTVDVIDLCDFGFVCELESVSIIYDTTSPTHLDVLSETDVNLDALDDGFGAYDCGAVLQDGTDIDDGCATDDGSGSASVGGSTAIDTTTGTSVFTLANDSYFADFFDDPTACDDGDPTFCFLISSTGIDVVIGPISIASTSPSAVNVGTTGTLTITGENLVNPFGGPQPDVQVQFRGGTGSGFTVSSPNFSPDGSGGTASYQVANNATVGSWNISISYVMGDTIRTSPNEGDLTVGYPAATVSNVSPAPWLAGQSSATLPAASQPNFKVTITGQSFGPSPTLSITGTGVSLIDFTPNANGQSIVATVSVDLTTPNESALVDVTPGYGGPFVCTCTGSPDGTFTVPVQAVPAPQAQILYFQNPIAAAQPVVVGQQISLSSNATTVAPMAVTSYSWSVPGPGATIASFTAGSANNAAGTTTSDQIAELLNFSNSGITFYFVSTGGASPTQNSITFSYCMVNNQCSPPVTGNFSVEGPINVAPNNLSPAITTTSINVFPANGRDFLAYQTIPPGAQPGIKFVAPNQPAVPADNVGTYQWLQFLTFDQSIFINRRGLRNCTTLRAPDGAELDTCYPYGSCVPGTVTTSPGGVPSDTATDSPNVTLVAPIGEWQRSFGATMYLRWIPNPDVPNCTAGAACTIPVPIGSASWHISGCAINTKAPQGDAGTNWTKSCPPDPQPPQNVGFTPSNPGPGNNFGYPTWGNVAPGSGCSNAAN
jgi:hypothetical protein